MSVSVVIPAYNSAAYIHKALESVFAQTVAVDEILVIDDGSKDHTREVVERYAPRVRLITQQNAGPSPARNLGVASSCSTYIAFLDADDAWAPEKIERQLAALAAMPTAVLCYTGLRNIFSDGTTAALRTTPLATLRDELRLQNPAIIPSCVMIARAAFEQSGGFTSLLKGSEDWDMWLRLAQLGPFCVVDEPLTLYTVSNTGLSANADHMYREAVSMLEDRLLAGLSGVKRWLWRRRILAYQAYKGALTARASAEHGKELRYILNSFLYWPSPFWHPHRLKVLTVRLRNAHRS